ncbi:MAG: hypothetical protein ACYC65_12280 [Candidatus Limnocylindrales bacterium]
MRAEAVDSAHLARLSRMLARFEGGPCRIGRALAVGGCLVLIGRALVSRGIGFVSLRRGFVSLRRGLIRIRRRLIGIRRGLVRTRLAHVPPGRRNACGIVIHGTYPARKATVAAAPLACT